MARLDSQNSIVFVGDVAIPQDYEIEIENAPKGLFENFLVLNLEGGIVDNEEQHIKKSILFNSHDVLHKLRRWNAGLCCLANNHILDVKGGLARTIRVLDEAQIAHCGAGPSLESAAKPVVIDINDHRVAFLAFGWETIECHAAGSNTEGVNPLRPKHVLSSIADFRRSEPDIPLVVLPHWGIELERYPLPIHRQLAFAAIDAGATAIVGCHSHIAQGIEYYNGCPIVYSLGNWILPSHIFEDGRITFPDECNQELALEWKPSSGEIIAHWFEYDPKNSVLRHAGSENPEHSDENARLTPFASMSHEDYCRWFRENRTKKKGVPIYEEIDAVFMNAVRDAWVWTRHRLIQGLIMLRIKDSVKGLFQ